MENKEKTGRFEALIEQFLLASITTPLILLVMYLFSSTLLKNNVERVFIDWFTYSLFCFSGLFYSFILYVFVKEKTKGGFYICFIVFYILFECLLCFLFNRLDMPYVIIPFSIIHFTLESVLNDVFVLHDAFLRHWDGKTGKDLETFLYHNNVEATDLGNSIKTYRSTLIGITSAFFIFCFFVKISGKNFSIPMIINISVFVVSVFFGFFKANYFYRESFYANMGFPEIVKNKRTFYKYLTLILLFSVTAALIFSRQEPVLNLHIKEFTPVQREYVRETPVEEQEYKGDVDVDKVDLDEVLGNIDDGYFFMIVFEIVKVAAIAILIFYVLYFLLRPFFTSGWKEFWKDNKLYEYFRKLLDDIKSFFMILFGKEPEVFATVEATTFKTSINNFIKKSKKSKEKKAELDRLTKQFMTLIDWGTKRDIKYKVNFAPAEYTKLIEIFFDNATTLECKTSAQTAGILFEKALYDKELLSKEEEKQYSEAVIVILSSGK